MKCVVHAVGAWGSLEDLRPLVCGVNEGLGKKRGENLGRKPDGSLRRNESY
jgi:hypothetical protein